MDHHCPWVNNCIGFYNRKFFMQLLFYVCLLTWVFNITLFPDIYKIGLQMWKEQLFFRNFWSDCLVFVGYAITFTLSILITMFLKFHVKLVLVNTTTIESLDKQNLESNKKVLKYINFKLT